MLEFILIGVLAHVTVVKKLSAVFAVSRVRGGRQRSSKLYKGRLQMS